MDRRRFFSALVGMVAAVPFVARKRPHGPAKAQSQPWRPLFIYDGRLPPGPNNGEWVYVSRNAEITREYAAWLRAEQVRDMQFLAGDQW